VNKKDKAQIERLEKKIDELSKNISTKTENKKILKESERAKHLGIIALGFAIFGLAIPTFIELMEFDKWQKFIFVIFYFGAGVYIIVDSTYILWKLKKGK